jgi:hypothetical protein|tara:strand:- start:319 stop:438 length:120 start_codon:yes stop_codon:yes gene_type:complete
MKSLLRIFKYARRRIILLSIENKALKEYIKLLRNDKKTN